MTKKIEEITIERLIADVFKEKLGAAGFSTRVLGYHHNSDINIHIHGVQKKHWISVKQDSCFQKNSLYILLRSEFTEKTHRIYRKSMIIEDPDFSLDFCGDLADKVVDFLDHMSSMDEAMRKASGIFDDAKHWNDPKFFDAEDPRFKKSSKTHK